LQTRLLRQREAVDVAAAAAPIFGAQQCSHPGIRVRSGLVGPHFVHATPVLELVSHRGTTFPLLYSSVATPGRLQRFDDAGAARRGLHPAIVAAVASRGSEP